MKNRNLMRRILLIIASILNCLVSVGYAVELYRLNLGNNLIKYSDNINIDGSDFTTFFNLMVSGINGVLILFTLGVAMVITTILTIIIVFLTRIVTIRKRGTIKKSELIFSKRLITVSSIISIIASILFTNTGMIIYILCLVWQQPLFMKLIYYDRLKKQCD